MVKRRDNVLSIRLDDELLIYIRGKPSRAEWCKAALFLAMVAEQTKGMDAVECAARIKGKQSTTEVKHE